MFCRQPGRYVRIHRGNSSWPGRHQGIGTAPPTQTSCIIVREITEDFPKNCYRNSLFHPRWVSWNFHDPPGRRKKKETPTSDAVSGAASITTWWCIKMTCIVGDVVSMSGLYVQLYIYIYVQTWHTCTKWSWNTAQKTIAETAHWRILHPFQVAYIWKNKSFIFIFSNKLEVLKQTW